MPCRLKPGVGIMPEREMLTGSGGGGLPVGVRSRHLAEVLWNQ